MFIYVSFLRKVFEFIAECLTHAEAFCVKDQRLTQPDDFSPSGSPPGMPPGGNQKAKKEGL